LACAPLFFSVVVPPFFSTLHCFFWPPFFLFHLYIHQITKKKRYSVTL
jgi:hypothetical protein